MNKNELLQLALFLELEEVKEDKIYRSVDRLQEIRYYLPDGKSFYVRGLYPPLKLIRIVTDKIITPYLLRLSLDGEEGLNNLRVLDGELLWLTYKSDDPELIKIKTTNTHLSKELIHILRDLNISIYSIY